MSQSRRQRAEEKTKGGQKPPAEKQSKLMLRLSPGVEKLLALFFGAAAIGGLGIGLWLSFTYPLTSDMANAGLLPMEAARGNFEFLLPANNPYIFTDYIVHMIIQPLTGYSPVALRLTAFAMYALIVLVSSGIALRLAGRLEALAAAALVASMPIASLLFMVYPLYHNGTILLILLSILVFYADRPPFRLSPVWRVSIIALLQFLGVFSDTLMLSVFTLPLLAYSAYRLAKERQAAKEDKSSNETSDSPALWIASTIPAFIAYILKSRIGQLWPGGPILTASSADLASPGRLLQHPEMLSSYITAMIDNAGGVVYAFVLLAVIALVILKKKDRFLQAILVIGGLVMLIGFMSMTMAGDPARYLTAVTILALIVAATGMMSKGAYYLPLIAVAAIVLLHVGSNALVMNDVARQDFTGNQQAMVDYLKSNNVTHAYADYWDANVYTYLSGGEARIVPVYVDDDKLRFQTMNSAPAWTDTWPDGSDAHPTFITTTGSSLDDWVKKVEQNHPPEKTYPLGDGGIYVFNGTLPVWPAGK